MAEMAAMSVPRYRLQPLGATTSAITGAPVQAGPALAGAGAGDGGQHVTVYGGLHLSGIQDAESLLGELHGLSI